MSGKWELKREGGDILIGMSPPFKLNASSIAVE